MQVLAKPAQAGLSQLYPIGTFRNMAAKEPGAGNVIIPQVESCRELLVRPDNLDVGESDFWPFCQQREKSVFIHEYTSEKVINRKSAAVTRSKPFRPLPRGICLSSHINSYVTFLLSDNYNFFAAGRV